MARMVRRRPRSRSPVPWLTTAPLATNAAARRAIWGLLALLALKVYLDRPDLLVPPALRVHPGRRQCPEFLTFP